jgi:hypothetical protein
MLTARSSCFGVYMALALLVSSPATADEQKIIRLEQDVRKLERIVQEQARQIDDLRRQLDRPGFPSTSSEAPPVAAPSSKWLVARNWERIRAGMSELDVLDLLGPPNQIRPGNNGSQVLLYATEIGTSGFLGGNVTVKDGKVVEAQRPTLR